MPRLMYAALTISQVYLIQNAVAFVEGIEPTSTGYSLIGGFAFVYIGLAVSYTLHPSNEEEKVGLLTRDRS